MVMRKHTQVEVLRMAELVRDEMTEILIGLGQQNTRARALADSIIRDYLGSLRNILDMPYGGTLSPDELAEMMLSQYVYKHHGHNEEEAAAALIAN